MGSSAWGEDGAARGDDAKGGGKESKELGLGFFSRVSSAIRIIRPQIIEGWWCG